MRRRPVLGVGFGDGITEQARKEGMNAVRRKGREECRGGVERNGAKDRV